METITTAANGTMTVPQYAEFGQIAAYTPSYWLDNVAVSDQGWIGGDQTVAGAVAASASSAAAGIVTWDYAVPGAVCSVFVSGARRNGITWDVPSLAL